MSLESLKNLKPAQPRQFVPAAADLGDWAQLEKLFLTLEAEGLKIKNVKGLQDWILRCSELGAAFDQEGATRYINKSCFTDDESIKIAFLHFISEIEPCAKPHWQKLKKFLLDCPFHTKLPRKRYEVFIRTIKNEFSLFRDENVALQVEEATLDSQYQEIMAAMSVKFQGKELTMQQLGRYQEEPDRAVRKEAWTLGMKRRLQDSAKIEKIYEKLLKLREKIARNAKLPSYRDYAFRQKNRFDYTPKECEDFHQAVEELVVPLARDIQKNRAKLLKVDRLRPWDLIVDALNRPALKPFEHVDVLVEKCHAIFHKIHPALARDFNILRERRLLDLDSRKGKQPGGYQCSLEEARVPFIFMNAVGTQQDVNTMLHEAGHAFHALATRKEPLLNYRSAPIEFCEVASMSMELLGGPHLSEFYNPSDAARARRKHMEGIIGLLPWIATIDAFQHWIYTHPGHTSAQRKAYWLSLLTRFGGIEDWSGYESARASMWHRQGHLFGMPFYYIEYGIAQLGALQLWLNAKKDTASAVTHYRKALSLGGSRPLPDIFKAAKLKFDFGSKTVKPLMQAVQKELRSLGSE